MNSLENLRVAGQLKIVVTDAQGNITDSRQFTNLVVTTGAVYIASRMVGAAATVMSHMAIGTGTVATAAAQSSLITELSAARSTVTATASTATGSVSYVASFGAGVGTGAITEAGIFNSATINVGTMLCRTVFPVVNKGASDSMTITWTVTLTPV